MYNISVTVNLKYSKVKIKSFLICFSTYKANTAIVLVFCILTGP